MTSGGSNVWMAEVRRAWQKVGMNRLALRRENSNVQAAWGVRVGREEVGSAFSRILAKCLQSAKQMAFFGASSSLLMASSFSCCCCGPDHVLSRPGAS
jgi:hypothetical protein